MLERPFKRKQPPSFNDWYKTLVLNLLQYWNLAYHHISKKLKKTTPQKLKYFIYTLTLIIFSSNDNRNKLESEYQKCINDKTFKRTIFYPLNTPEFDLPQSVSEFDSIKKFENYLHDTGYLSDFNKEDYLSLVSRTDQIDFLKKEYRNYNSDNHFINYNLMTQLFFEELFYDCIMSLFKNQVHYDYLLETKDKINLNSYPNSEILTELVNEVDFHSKTQRLIITYLIYCNLYWKYEMNK